MFHVYWAPVLLAVVEEIEGASASQCLFFSKGYIQHMVHENVYRHWSYTFKPKTWIIIPFHSWVHPCADVNEVSIQLLLWGFLLILPVWSWFSNVSSRYTIPLSSQCPSWLKVTYSCLPQILITNWLPIENTFCFLHSFHNCTMQKTMYHYHVKFLLEKLTSTCYYFNRLCWYCSSRCPCEGYDTEYTIQLLDCCAR